MRALCHSIIRDAFLSYHARSSAFSHYLSPELRHCTYPHFFLTIIFPFHTLSLISLILLFFSNFSLGEWEMWCCGCKNGREQKRSYEKKTGATKITVAKHISRIRLYRLTLLVFWSYRLTLAQNGS